MAWELEEAMAYFKGQGAPGDQTALVALLREVQQEFRGIPSALVTAIAQGYGVKEGLLLALIRRIPSLRLADTHILELCAGPNCGKCRALADLAEQANNAKAFTLRYTPCMRRCAQGPNLRWDGTLYQKADEALLKSLLSTLP